MNLVDEYSGTNLIKDFKGSNNMTAFMVNKEKVLQTYLHNGKLEMELTPQAKYFHLKKDFSSVIDIFPEDVELGNIYKDSEVNVSWLTTGHYVIKYSDAELIITGNESEMPTRRPNIKTSHIVNNKDEDNRK